MEGVDVWVGVDGSCSGDVVITAGCVGCVGVDVRSDVSCVEEEAAMRLDVSVWEGVVSEGGWDVEDSCVFVDA